jgi:hypothetical protein
MRASTAPFLTATPVDGSTTDAAMLDAAIPDAAVPDAAGGSSLDNATVEPGANIVLAGFTLTNNRFDGMTILSSTTTDSCFATARLRTLSVQVSTCRGGQSPDCAQRLYPERARGNYWDHVPPTQSSSDGSDFYTISGTMNAAGAMLAPSPCP